MVGGDVVKLQVKVNSAGVVHHPGNPTNHTSSGAVGCSKFLILPEINAISGLTIPFGSVLLPPPRKALVAGALEVVLCVSCLLGGGSFRVDEILHIPPRWYIR